MTVSLTLVLSGDLAGPDLPNVNLAMGDVNNNWSLLGSHSIAADHGKGLAEVWTCPADVSAARQISIQFTNDFYQPPHDRNAYVHAVYVGTTLLPMPGGTVAALMSGGQQVVLTMPSASAPPAPPAAPPPATPPAPPPAAPAPSTLPSVRAVMAQPDPSKWAVKTIGSQPGDDFPTFTQALFWGCLQNDGKADKDIVGFVYKAARVEPDVNGKPYFFGDTGCHARRFGDAGIGFWPYWDATWNHPVVIDLGGNTVAMDPASPPYYQCGWINSDKYDVSVRNGRLTGFTRGDQNGNYCAVFLGDPHGYDVRVVLEDLQIDGCDDGLRGGQAGITLTMTRVMFTGNGLGSYGLTHNCYVGGGESVTATDCVSTNVTGGHLFKSRAAVTTIEGCTFADGPEGSSSYVLDVPNGGTLTVSNTVLAHGPGAVAGSILAVGEEGASNSPTGQAWPTTIALNNVTLVSQGADSTQPVGIWNALDVKLTLNGVSVFGDKANQVQDSAHTRTTIPEVVEMAQCPSWSMKPPTR